MIIVLQQPALGLVRGDHVPGPGAPTQAGFLLQASSTRKGGSWKVANATRDASVAPAPVHTRYTRVTVPGGDRLVPVLKVAMPLVPGPHVLLERKDW